MKSNTKFQTANVGEKKSGEPFLLYRARWGEKSRDYQGGHPVKQVPHSTFNRKPSYSFQGQQHHLLQVLDDVRRLLEKRKSYIGQKVSKHIK